MKILVFDNYDSFTYNLVHLVEKITNQKVTVVRNDQMDLDDVAGYDKIILSPGPGIPSEAGLLLPLIRQYAASKSILGVCLGHQAIAEASGAVVTNAEELMHGKVSKVTHEHDVLFTDVPATFDATRYHSLAVVRETVPSDLTVTAQTQSGTVMALRHKDKPIWGVQFHPESVLTEGGYQMLGNWLEQVGLAGAADTAKQLSPLLAEETRP